ncbi:hypothetical protein EV175_005816 [Coemansia sp. RSA 1933]|nr:hypothetical protein EV175_005816 [Coemansia sp. RSA 1933]
MVSSSWANARFMRQNGAFVGATNVASSVITLVVSGIFATATLQQIQVQSGKREMTLFCERITNDTVERLVSCLMAAWWLSMSVNISNMAFIYRDEIKICIKMTMPRRRLHGVSKEAAATACRVFHGSMSLNWILCIFWVTRSWRTFTRETKHFDSTIFKEPSESTMDLYASKLVNTNNTPNTDGPTPLFNQGYMPSGSQHPEIPDRPSTQLSGCKMCSCSDCKPSPGVQQNQSMFSHEQSAAAAAMYRVLATDTEYSRTMGSQQQQHQSSTVPLPVATAPPSRSNRPVDDYSRDNQVPPPFVGTATLETERI